MDNNPTNLDPQKNTQSPFGDEMKKASSMEESKPVFHTMKGDLESLEKTGELPSGSVSEVEAPKEKEAAEIVGKEEVSESPFLVSQKEAPVAERVEEQEVVEKKEMVRPSFVPEPSKVSAPKPAEQAPVTAGYKGPFGEEDLTPQKPQETGKFIGTIDERVSKVPTPTPEAVPVETEAPAISEPTKNVLQERMEQMTPSEAMTPDEEKEEGVAWGRILIIAFVVIILLAGGAGGYYFYFMRPTEEPVIVEEVPEEEEEVEIVEEPEKIEYSLEMPNYLIVDPNTFTVTDFYGEIDNVFSNFPEGEKGPYEFVVTEASHAGISLDEFFSMAGISLGNEVKGNLMEDFSVILYKDGEKERMMLSIGVLEGSDNNLIQGMRNTESSIVEALSGIFMDDNVLVGEGERSFSNSKYQGVEIRYLNLNLTTGLSIDYAIVNGNLVIATSKNSMRAAIDDMLMLESSSAQEKAETNEKVE